MESKLTGIRSLLLVGLTAGVVAVPSISWSVALSNEEIRTSYASTSTTPNRQRTIQVGPRDTLWSIARTTRPNDNVTIKQAMLAIRDANNSAFPSGNINEMEVGVRLVIPSVQAMTRRSAMQAEQEVRRQNQAWVASRAPAAPAAKVTPAKPSPQVTAKPQQPVLAPVAPPAPKPQVEVKQQPLDLPDDRVSAPQRDLTLVAPKANEAQQQRINKLEENLASSEESLQTVEREKDELAERISDMQQQVSTLQQLIQLKDQQLADMEQQLALEQSQPGSSRIIVPKAPEPQDLASQIKRQPELYGALAGSAALLLILFFALISARRKLKAERKQNQQAVNSNVLNTAFSEDQATSADFDLDLNSKPLEGLDDLEGLESLEGLGELDPLEFDVESDISDDLLDDLQDDDFNLENLEDELGDIGQVKTTQPAANQQQLRDPLQEAETFIAYGRLEQAAGFLQAALQEEPGREDLRIKLLEVLVELNDEETFRHQQQQLVANSASTAGLARADELAKLFVAVEAAAALSSSQASEEDLGELDLGELDLDDLDFGNDLNDLDKIFPGEDEVAFNEPENRFEASGVIDDSIDDLADLDSLEADLDGVIATKKPQTPTAEDSLEDESFDLEELDETGLENLELELDLEKPLDANELADQGDSSADFEPVGYKSDADDFMDALDSLNLDDEAHAPASNMEIADPQQAPGVDEELAELNQNFAELEALSGDSPHSISDNLDDLSELDDLDVFEGLDDLGDLGDQDLDLDDIEGGMSTQLDLATAYIEMGDKEGAREILEKVAKEGDADLKATAQQMLEALSN